MVRSIDPYLNAEDVRRITSGRSLCFVDAEAHTPNSVLLVNGTVYYIRSTTAMKVRDLTALSHDFGYDSGRQVAASVRMKFPKLTGDEAVYLIRIGVCRCRNCYEADTCPNFDVHGVCQRWRRGWDSC